MSQHLVDRLQDVRVQSYREAGPLQIFSLFWENPEQFRYLTLDEALVAGTLEVTELHEQGSVPVLQVINKAELPVFLMAGEQLLGAKQNRVLNASILVAAQSMLPIPVSCVEAGRWRYHSPKFRSDGTMSHGKLRKMMSKHSQEGYRLAGSPLSKQGEVWSEVSRKLSKLGSFSPSQALDQVYADFQQQLGTFLRAVVVPACSCGAVFVVGGRIAGADLFDKPETLAKLFPKLVRSYALDAFEMDETPPPVALEEVRTWLQSSNVARVEVFKSPGLGHDVRLEGKTLIGAGLVVEEHPIHVELFFQDGAA